MTFKQKWENYWYHYKWHTVAAVFALSLVAVVLESYINKTEPDLYMVYLSNSIIEEDSIDRFEKDLVSKEAAEDVDGDGKIIVHLEHLVSTFEADSYAGEGNAEKMQAVMFGGQHTLMLVHQYALEDYDGYFQNLSDKVKEGDKTFKSPSEGFVSGISVEGNEYLESMGINTENLYIAIRRRTDEDIKKGKDDAYFDLAYKTMDYVLGR